MSYSIYRMYCNFRYHIGVITSWLLYRSFISRRICKINSYFEARNVEKRLRDKGYATAQIVEIMGRFVSIKKCQSDRETKEAIQYLSRFIAEYSEKTGIPQWEVRALIQRDFGIDV